MVYQPGSLYEKAKMTEAQVFEARRRFTRNNRTDGCRALAREMGVSRNAM